MMWEWQWRRAGLTLDLLGIDGKFDKVTQEALSNTSSSAQEVQGMQTGLGGFRGGS